MIKPASSEVISANVATALAEDIGSGDLTAQLLPHDLFATAKIVCREDAVLSGSQWLVECFKSLDPSIEIDWHFQDGDRLREDDLVCHLKGNARAIVSAERAALNFLQTLSATASVTAQFVAAVADAKSGTVILDTRKTLPGMRQAQKYAVRCGGGQNHRIGLFDAILIKENHIAAAGSIELAVQSAREIHASALLIVEVETLAELEQALLAKPDRILLDNFSLEQMRCAVALAKDRCPLEVSGNVSLETVAQIAATGVQYISVGALTKNITATDYSLRLELHASI